MIKHRHIARLLAATVVISAFATFAQAKVENFAGVRQEVADGDCSGSASCFVYFVAAETDIQIHQVTCNFYINGSTAQFQVTGAQLIRSSRDESRTLPGPYLPNIFPMAIGSDFVQFQFTSDVLWGIPQNWRPVVNVNFDKVVPNAHFTCTVSGPNTP